MNNSKVNVEEQQGIRAIQYLQSLVGIDESEEDALNGWKDMSKYEKQNTMAAYSALGGENIDEKTKGD